ncbi:MAG: RNA polymerase sigma factor [Gemmatimonadota bacterium]
MDWADVYANPCEDLVRFLYRKAWDEDRARDLTQELFARALPHRPENPRAWLFSAAVNLARDEARRVVRRRKHLALLRGRRGRDGPRGESRPEEVLSVIIGGGGSSSP